MRHSDRPDLGTGGPLEQLDRYPFTLGVLAANVILFGFCAFKSGGTQISGDILSRMGANDYLYLSREPWRLVTATFLHADLIHLALNCWALWSIGRLIEVHYGSARTWVLYLGSALAGGLASAAWHWFHHAPVVSSGASAGVFGLICMGWCYTRSAPERLGSVAEQLRNWILVLAVYTAFLLFRGGGGVDHAAHAGGGFAGAIMGTLIQPRPGEDRHPAWAVLAHLLAIGALLSFGAVVWTLRQGRLPE